MKSYWISITALMVSVAANGATNALTPEEKSAGWILLFDGKSMKGWVDPRQKTPPGDGWTIDDGCLKATSKPRYREDLFTQQTFRDFDLVFDWRISPAGNSGVKYRIRIICLSCRGSRTSSLKPACSAPSSIGQMCARIKARTMWSDSSIK